MILIVVYLVQTVFDDFSIWIGIDIVAFAYVYDSFLSVPLDHLFLNSGQEYQNDQAATEITFK